MYLPFFNSTAVQGQHVITSYVVMLVLYLGFLLCKKFHYKFSMNREYLIIPKLKIRSISDISMMTAMNIALIISISLLSNYLMAVCFRVYPGARFLIENVLIKLGGILFGPLIGLFIGLTTDLLTIIFTSSVMNYGYFFSAMVNGFLGGLIHLIIKNKDPRKIKQTIYSVGLSFISLIFLLITLSKNSTGGYISARILSLSLSFPWWLIFSFIFLVVFACACLLVTSTFAINHLHDPRYIHLSWMRKLAEKNLFFLILMCNCSIYLLVDIISLPLFDIKLSSLPYEQFLISRSITSIPSIILFSYILSYIYKLHMDIRGMSGRTDNTYESGLQPIKVAKRKTFLPNIIH